MSEQEQQDMRDVALLDQTTVWYQVATKNREELKALHAPSEIVNPLDTALTQMQDLIQQGIFDQGAYTQLFAAWVSAQNWLHENRGDSK